MRCRSGLLALMMLLGSVLVCGGSPGGRSEFRSHSGYISLMRISENMGAELNFDRVLGEVRISRENRSLLFVLGRRDLIYRKELLQRLQKPPVVEKGEVLVPLDALRFIFRELSLPGESWVIKSGSLEDVNRKPDHVLPPTASSPAKINVVFLDPGHGGMDPGALGPGGFKESTLVLDVSRRVARLLEAGLPGIKIVLLRKDNRTLSLNGRAKIANRYIKQGYRGLFVSVHANGFRFPGRSGYETYFLSPIASDAESRATAAMENGVLSIDPGDAPGGEMDSILSKMLVEEYRRESLRLATFIQEGLKRRIGVQSQDRGVKKANFFVMRGVYMPSVLVEIGFITNPREAALLKTNAYKNKVAAGIASGIGNFLSSYNRN
jgi:N-acetylmuramoyl-L-alanine amidase